MTDGTDHIELFPTAPAAATNFPSGLTNGPDLSQNNHVHKFYSNPTVYYWKIEGDGGAAAAGTELALLLEEQVK